MPLSPRDYAAEMAGLIEQFASKGPYTPRVLASDIVQFLRDNDPALLDGWLRAQAEQFVWQAINDADRHLRGSLGQTAKPRAFSKATAALRKTGDTTQLRQFLDARYTIADGTRRPLAELTAADVEYVASGYAKLARANALKAAFFGALAKRIGEGTVADHFTDEQLREMWSGLS